MLALRADVRRHRWRHEFGMCKVPTRSAILHFILALGTIPGLAQDPCPFPDSVAVTDTLAPSGYLPFDVGNLWEYRSFDGAIPGSLGRTEVVADTVIDGRSFAVVRGTIFESSNATVYHASGTSTWYFGKAESAGLTWSADEGFEEYFGLHLDAPFQSCYSEGGVDDAVHVSGGYTDIFTLAGREGTDTIGTSAVKEYVRFAVEGITVVHGIGVTRIEGDPNLNTHLVYFDFGDRSAGIPLDEQVTIVGVEHSSVQSLPSVSISPNPASSEIVVEVEMAEPTQLSIEVFDLLGRQVGLTEYGQATGRWRRVVEVRGLSRGLYVVVVRTRSEAISRMVIVTN